MTIFTWAITSMTRDTAPEYAAGGIIKASWSCAAVDGDITSAAYGVATFAPDPSAPDYTPYDDLTQDQVLAWCWAGDTEGFAQVDRAYIEPQLQGNIDTKSVTSDGVPWPVSPFV